MIKNLVLVFLVMILSAEIIPAQDFSQEVKEQAPVILKAMNYNSTLKDKIKTDCIIAVLFNPQSALSEQEKKSIIDAIKDNDKIKIHGKKVKAIEIPMTANLNLEKKVIINKINAFWLTSDLKPYIDTIKESAKYNQVITISADQNLVTEATVAIGTQKTENGYKVLVNINEANNINVNLSDNLLSQAIVIK
jgi:uncharacterized membrane protein YdfJ with MMPL/SSD domain